MKRLKIKNPYANFISPDFATDEEMQAWIDKELHNGNYGKPAWTEKKLVGEMKFEDGQDVSEYETIEHEAEYSYEVKDISAEIAAIEQEKAKLKTREDKRKSARKSFETLDMSKVTTIAQLKVVVASLIDVMEQDL